jgi:hypothetical protein
MSPPSQRKKIMKDKTIELMNWIVTLNKNVRIQMSTERYAVLAWACLATSQNNRYRLTNGANRFFWRHKVEGLTHVIDITFDDKEATFSIKQQQQTLKLETVSA